MNVTLFGNRAFTDTNKPRRGHQGGTRPYKMKETSCDDSGTWGEGHVKTVAEIGEMQLQGQEHQAWPATPRSWEGQAGILSYRFQRERGPANTFILHS